MALAQKIGERYIWCDALCLIQNDPDDVDRGIKSMDLIYENAELTVVAACGHDANAGLPGVHKSTRMRPRFSWEITRRTTWRLYKPRPANEAFCV